MGCELQVSAWWSWQHAQEQQGLARSAACQVFSNISAVFVCIGLLESLLDCLFNVSKALPLAQSTPRLALGFETAEKPFHPGVDLPLVNDPLPQVWRSQSCTWMLADDAAKAAV